MSVSTRKGSLVDYSAALTGNETSKDAEKMEIQALKLEDAGRHLDALQLMEKALQIRCQECNTGGASPIQVIEASEAAERLVTKSNACGVKCFKEGDYKAAETLLGYALEMTEENSFPLRETEDRRRYLRGLTLNNYGCMERRRGHFSEALTYIQRSMECTVEQSPVAYLNISAVQTQLRLCEDAAESAMRAMQLLGSTPEDPFLLAVAHHNLAMALEPVDPQRALEEYQSALALAQGSIGSDSETTHTIERNMQRFVQGSQRARSGLRLPEPFVGGVSPRRQMRGTDVYSASVSGATPPSPQRSAVPRDEDPNIFPHPFTSSAAEGPAADRPKPHATRMYHPRYLSRKSVVPPRAPRNLTPDHMISQMRSEKMTRPGPRSPSYQQTRPLRLPPVQQQQQQQQMQMQKQQMEFQKQQQMQMKQMELQKQQQQKMLTQMQKQQMQQQQQQMQKQQMEFQKQQQQQQMQKQQMEFQKQQQQQQMQMKQQMEFQKQQQQQQLQMQKQQMQQQQQQQQQQLQRQKQHLEEQRLSLSRGTSGLSRVPKPVTSASPLRDPQSSVHRASFSDMKPTAARTASGKGRGSRDFSSSAESPVRTYPRPHNEPQAFPRASQSVPSISPTSLRGAAQGKLKPARPPAISTTSPKSAAANTAPNAPSRPKGSADATSAPVKTIDKVRTSPTSAARGPSSSKQDLSSLPITSPPGDASQSNVVAARRKQGRSETRGSTAAGDLVSYMTDRLDMLVVDEEEHKRKNTSAGIIQRAFRLHTARRRLIELRDGREWNQRLSSVRERIAARTLQRHFRRYFSSSWGTARRRRTREMHASKQQKAAVRIQSWARVWLTRRACARRRFYEANADLAALTVQCWWRRVSAGRELRRRRRAHSIAIAAAVEAERREIAATAIQTRWRARTAERLTRVERRRAAQLRKKHIAARQKSAAESIQSWWRLLVARAELRRLQANCAAREARIRENQRMIEAAMKLQAFGRMLIVQREAEPLLTRARIAAAKRIRDQCVENQCASKIQRAYRSHYAKRLLARHRRAHREAMLRIRGEAMAAIVQRLGRGYIIRRTMGHDIRDLATEAQTYHRKVAALEVIDRAERREADPVHLIPPVVEKTIKVEAQTSSPKQMLLAEATLPALPLREVLQPLESTTVETDGGAEERCEKSYEEAVEEQQEEQEEQEHQETIVETVDVDASADAQTSRPIEHLPISKEIVQPDRVAETTTPSPPREGHISPELPAVCDESEAIELEHHRIQQLYRSVLKLEEEEAQTRELNSLAEERSLLETLLHIEYLIVTFSEQVGEQDAEHVAHERLLIEKLRETMSSRGSGNRDSASSTPRTRSGHGMISSCEADNIATEVSRLSYLLAAENRMQELDREIGARQDPHGLEMQSPDADLPESPTPVLRDENVAIHEPSAVTKEAEEMNGLAVAVVTEESPDDAADKEAAGKKRHGGALAAALRIAREKRHQLMEDERRLRLARDAQRESANAYRMQQIAAAETVEGVMRHAPRPPLSRRPRRGRRGGGGGGEEDSAAALCESHVREQCLRRAVAAEAARNGAAVDITRVARGHLDRRYVRALRQLLDKYNACRAGAERAELPLLERTVLQRYTELCGDAVGRARAQRCLAALGAFVRAALSARLVWERCCAAARRPSRDPLDAIAGRVPVLRAKLELARRQRAVSAHLIEEDAARRIEHCVRAWLARRELARRQRDLAEHLIKEDAARCIANSTRAWLARKELARRVSRASDDRTYGAAVEDVLDSAALRVQRAFRLYRARRRAEAERDAQREYWSEIRAQNEEIAAAIDAMGATADERALLWATLGEYECEAALEEVVSAASEEFECCVVIAQSAVRRWLARRELRRRAESVQSAHESRAESEKAEPKEVPEEEEREEL